MRNDSQKRQLHKGNGDQRGFSLIEVIIAMVILAIIAVPLCHAFVTASRTNAKARKQACANAVAENVMEGINAYSFEDIVTQFGSSVSNDQFLISTNCDNKGIVSGMTVVDGVETPGSVMVYQIGSVDEDVYEFDVKVTVDTTAYEGDETNPGINDMEFVQLTSFDADKDYLFAQSKEEEIEAYQTLAGRTGIYTATQFEGKVQRTMTIILTKGSESLGDYVRVSHSMEYKYVGAEGWLTGDNAIYTRVYPARQYTTEDFLRNVYLCYIPNYASTISSPQMDRIVINNADELEVNFYIMKQVDGADLFSKENSYVPTVEVTEGATGGDCKLSFYTNYGENLADGTKITTAKPQYVYHYETAEGVAMSKSGADAEAALAPEGAMETVTANRLYHVTVEVYESGAYGHFADADTSGLKMVTKLTSY